jgi:hypothetical protein
MTISTFEDRAALLALRADIDAALATVATKHGIALRTGNIKYDFATCTIQVKAEITAAKADQDMKWANQFADMMSVDISQPSTHPQRKGATVTGYDASKRSKPWKFEWNGKAYITDDAGIRLMFPTKAHTPARLAEVDNLLSREVAPPKFG